MKRKLDPESKSVYLAARASLDGIHLRNGPHAPWKRQYFEDAAERALGRLREAFANGLISLETLESVTEDIVFGRPTRMPPLPPRDPMKGESR